MCATRGSKSPPGKFQTLRSNFDACRNFQRIKTKFYKVLFEFVPKTFIWIPKLYHTWISTIPPRNEELVAPLSPRTALFQENSLNQILFDQKFSKLDLTQKRHVQNDWETSWPLLKSSGIEKVRKTSIIYKQNPIIEICEYTEVLLCVAKQEGMGLFAYHCLRSHCCVLGAFEPFIEAHSHQQPNRIARQLTLCRDFLFSCSQTLLEAHYPPTILPFINEQTHAFRDYGLVQLKYENMNVSLNGYDFIACWFLGWFVRKQVCNESKT